MQWFENGINNNDDASLVLNNMVESECFGGVFFNLL